MPLENFEIAKNVGELIKDIGEAMKPDSEGGTTIKTKEWVEIGIKFATAMGADWIDDDEE